MDKNGVSSSSKCTKHINIRFFFINDRIGKKELNVEWCPTNEMIVYFMTKPIQGSIFKKFRELILGFIPIKNYIQESEIGRSVSEYLFPETRRHKETKGVYWESDIHRGSIRQTDGI